LKVCGEVVSLLRNCSIELATWCKRCQ
jgi:hypothetical protein